MGDAVFLGQPAGINQPFGGLGVFERQPQVNAGPRGGLDLRENVFAVGAIALPKPIRNLLI